MRITILRAFLYVLVACSSHSAEPADTAQDCLRRGDMHLDARQYEKAISEYTRAIQLKPDFAEALNNRAYAFYSKYDGTGDPLTDLNRAIALRPDFAHAYNTRGCVFMSAGDPDKAISDFNRATELQPVYPRAFRNRANAYLRKREFRLAIADFERAGANPKRTILYAGIVLMTLVGALGAIVMFAVRRRRQ